MIFRSSRLIWVLVALAALLGGAWLARELYRGEPVLASGTWLSPPRELEEFVLTDDTGQPFTLEQLRGAPTLVYFGFTSCPDVCPTTLATLARVKKAAGVGGLRVLLISVDPQNDTPAVLGRYVHAFDPQFKGATGTQTAIDGLTKAFSVAVSRTPLAGGNDTVDHSAAVFLVDRKARLTAVFSPPFEVGRFAGDLRNAASQIQ